VAADDYGGGVAAAKGVPYSRLMVGMPAEHHPLEKRVAATPEVSGASRASHPHTPKKLHCQLKLLQFNCN
jgi:hypothetical protein